METKKKSVSEYVQEYGAFIALIVLVVGIGIVSPEFRTWSNFLSLLRQSSINGFIAFGMTCVILTDAIDLSVGSILGLSTALCAGMIASGFPVVPAMILALVIGTGLGLVSGILVTKGRLQAFIATLVTMTVYRGLTMIFMDGKPISNLGDSFALKLVGKGNVFRIPIPVILFVLAFIAFYFMLNKTTFGRRIYATGSNSKCARLAGVDIDKTKIIVYGISGFMSALSGLILLSRLNSAQPTLGDGYEMDAIAATALGGTSMSGGVGRIGATFIGALIMDLLSSGLNFMNVPFYWQYVCQGVVVLGAVFVDLQIKKK